MVTSITQANTPKQVSRGGRPSATTLATLEANMDRIAVARDDETILCSLLKEERVAIAHCRCADKKLHSLDCKIGELIRQRRFEIDRAIEENARLSGAA